MKPCYECLQSLSGAVKYQLYARSHMEQVYLCFAQNCAGLTAQKCHLPLNDGFSWPMKLALFWFSFSWLVEEGEKLG